MRPRAAPLIPVSWGELIDKIVILEIKCERLKGPGQANAARELALLRAVAGPVLAEDAAIACLAAALAGVNRSLWDIEDRIRGKEAAAAFDSEFIELARSVYKTNDRRSALKREINLKLGSELVEEKSYNSS